MKLGKCPPKLDSRSLRAEHYMLTTTGAPDSIDYGAAYEKIAKATPPYPLYGNDKIGCCTAAALGHAYSVWAALDEQLVVPSPDAVLGLYSAISGYNPQTGANDTGCVELDVLNYARHNLLDGQGLFAFAKVSLANLDAVKQALFTFGGLYLGLDLPTAAEAQFDSKQPWTVPAAGDQTPGFALGSWGGHAVNAVAYDATGLTVITWGTRQPMSWDFFSTYCDEAWALIPALWQVKAPNANILDWATLQQDLAAIGQVNPTAG